MAPAYTAARAKAVDRELESRSIEESG